MKPRLRPTSLLGSWILCGASVLCALACADRMVAAGLEIDLGRCENVECAGGGPLATPIGLELTTCVSELLPPLSVGWQLTDPGGLPCGPESSCQLVNFAVEVSPLDGSLWVTASAATEAAWGAALRGGTLLARGVWLGHYSADGHPLSGIWVDREFDPTREASYVVVPRLEAGSGHVLIAVEKSVARYDQGDSGWTRRVDFTQWLAEFDAAGEPHGLRIPVARARRSGWLSHAAAAGRVALSDAPELGSSEEAPNKGGGVGVFDMSTRQVQWIQSRHERANADLVELEPDGRVHLLTRYDAWNEERYEPAYALETYGASGTLERELSLAPLAEPAFVWDVAVEASGALLIGAVLPRPEGQTSCLLRAERDQSLARMTCIPPVDPTWNAWDARLVPAVGLIATMGPPLSFPWQAPDAAPMLHQISSDLGSCRLRALPAELRPRGAQQWIAVARGQQAELYFATFEGFGRLE